MSGFLLGRVQSFHQKYKCKPNFSTVLYTLISACCSTNFDIISILSISNCWYLTKAYSVRASRQTRPEQGCKFAPHSNLGEFLPCRSCVLCCRTALFVFASPLSHWAEQWNSAKEMKNILTDTKVVLLNVIKTRRGISNNNQDFSKTSLKDFLKTSFSDFLFLVWWIVRLASLQTKV